MNFMCEKAVCALCNVYLGMNNTLNTLMISNNKRNYQENQLIYQISTQTINMNESVN